MEVVFAAYALSAHPATFKSTEPWTHDPHTSKSLTLSYSRRRAWFRR